MEIIIVVKFIILKDWEKRKKKLKQAILELQTL